MTATQTYDGRKSRIASIVLLSLLATACGGSDEQPAQSDTDAGGRAGGGKGGAGAGGKGDSGTSAGTAGDAGTALPMMMITCTEPVPTTPVMCGGEVCQAPAQFTGNGNPCIVPCCIMQGDKEVCASKSTAVPFSSECAAPAVADPQCPEVDAPGTPLAAALGLRGGVFTGCCNARQHKCGIISTQRPGCITESLTVTLPSDPPACNEASDDGGTDLDGG